MSLEPDLVVNDMLDTTSEYILKLKSSGVRVVNFEDLGAGAALTDITFNELYTEPIIEGKNIRWGHDYCFLREEFSYASARSFNPNIKNVLVTFGGTDQHNLTQRVLSGILPFCIENGIHVQVVAGPGYLFKNELADFIADKCPRDVDFTSATGIISKIMEMSDIAICSNGRTVYELAHMNIPSIVISQHPREVKHSFASAENGFIHLGCCAEFSVESQVLEEFRNLFFNTDVRKSLFETMRPFDFLSRKAHMVSMILKLLDGK
jgi:spore coat polysaccharide biosynthesis predicted glycosyltransferase SpsG